MIGSDAHACRTCLVAGLIARPSVTPPGCVPPALAGNIAAPAHTAAGEPSIRQGAAPAGRFLAAPAASSLSD
jgi:hypothetical protein